MMNALRHFGLHAGIGFVAGLGFGPEIGIGAALGGVAHMELEDQYTGQSWRRTAQNSIERGAGAVIGVGLGALLRSAVFG